MKRLLAVCLAAAFVAASAWAAQEKSAAPKAPAAKGQGAAQIALNGGSRGNIDFPHLKHQATLKDCSVCHRIFTQEPGVIVKMKAGGKLEPKAVMKVCIGCHKERIAAGQPTGPVACAKCHGTAP